MGSSSQRPRQRTSTSCTECRRRKQKCNQAKDRPCNNCARRYPPVACIYDGGHSRDSTVERVIDLQEASGDSTPGYENMSQHSNSSYIPVSDEHYASSSNAYYAPAQTATTTASYWPEQDPTWNNQYTAPSSSSYDASYYNVSTTQARGQSYDAGYYATEYSAAFPQQSPWFPATSGDTRTYVQNSTAYDNFVDSSTSPLRRNGDGTHYSHSGTDNC